MTMPRPLKYLLGFLVLIGFSIFVYGSALAMVASWRCNKDCQIASFLSSAVTSIGAILATNLGAVLGITSSNPTSEFRKNKSWNPLAIISDPSPTIVQTFACYLYILVLFATAITWAHAEFDENVVPIIQEMAKSLLGVIVGAMVIALNTPSIKNDNIQ